MMALVGSIGISFWRPIANVSRSVPAFPFRGIVSSSSLYKDKPEESCSRSQTQAEKLREKTPIGKLDDQPVKHPAQEKEPLPPWPEGVNPNTGEIGGPKGPEPTRYGDWERKGRVSDF